MSVGTKIEWTYRPGTIPATMNALVGCQKVSEACRNCYAIDTAHVRAGNPLPVMQDKFGGTTRREGGKTLWTGKVTLTEKALLGPLTKSKPHTYFVNSMSDLFYDGVPDEWIDRHFAVFALCPQHTFIVLTKRPERMHRYLSNAIREGGGTTKGFISEQFGRPARFFPEMFKRLPLNQDVFAMRWPLPNVWLGVSVENQETVKRVWPLLQTPAAVRFLSCEPLLGPVDLAEALGLFWAKRSGIWKRKPLFDDSDGDRSASGGSPRFVGEATSEIDWVITGGESGHGARPMHPDWARSLRDQCKAAGVPFFFKQWGEWYPVERTPERNARVTMPGQNRDLWGWPDGKTVDSWRTGIISERVGKAAAGHLLDGVEHHAFPEVR